MADIEPFAGMTQEATLKEIARRLAGLADAIGVLSPDSAGRLRVAAETLGTLATVTTVTTVTTVGTVTNMAQIGGSAANQFIPITALLGEGDLRRNIVIS